MPPGPLILIEEFATPVEELWAWWTEPDEVREWLAGDATIDAKVGGHYLLKGPIAGRPAEGMMGGPILGLEEEYVLKVAWRLPPELGPNVSGASPATTLTVLFQPLGPNRTRLRLEHDGWRDGEDWARAFQWQTETWNAVLARLRERA